MSVLGVIGEIGKTIAKIAPIIWGALQGARSLIPVLDGAMSKLEEALQKGGMEADDFIDRNEEFFLAASEVGNDMQIVGYRLKELCEGCLQYATDDIVDTDEAKEIVEDLQNLAKAVEVMVTRQELPQLK